MKKIIISLAVIGLVGAVAVAATTAFFSDTETSTGNTFTAGTIDISVDGQNPWNKSWKNELDKPCETNYMTFTIKNEGKNPARIWKRLTGIENGPGVAEWPENQTPICSSEPEFEAGGGTVTYTNDVPSYEGNYVERDNLSAFMVYDMSICVLGGGGNANTCGTTAVKNTSMVKPVDGTGWQVLIDETDQVRVDNVADSWIELTKEIEKLDPNQELVVSQSYHLMTWDDSGQPMITNWAQGDVMTFDVELEARQMTAPAPGTTYSGQPGQPGVVQATVGLVKKDPTTWEVVQGASGSLTYAVEGATFDYDLSATGLTASTQYSLIYYADPYPGNHPGKLINTYVADESGNISALSQSVDLGMDLPDSADANYPAGAKVWLVLSSDYNGSNTMTAWNPASYLFDLGLVTYHDTNL